MKKGLLIILLTSALYTLQGQYFREAGKGLSIRTFPGQQNYYLHDMDSSGQIFAIYYDTVTSSSNFGNEYSQIRLQVYDGISWLFSKPIRLYSKNSVDAPRILDIRVQGHDVYVCGSFDSSQNNLGAGIIKFSNRTWQSCNANLLQVYPDYFEVNRCYVFNYHILITGNFDSIPGTKVNGILLWNGTSWVPVGKAGNYGFRNLSGTSNVFFQVVDDSLYAFNKNKIKPDSMEIGGNITRKLAVFRNGQFTQVNVPVTFIGGLSSFQQKLVVIPSSELVYTTSLLLWESGVWKKFNLPDSFYATTLASSINAGNTLYLLFQNVNTKHMDVYGFSGTSINRLPSFKLSDNYVALEARVMRDEMSISGNFRSIQKGLYSDSFSSIARIIFRPGTVYTGSTFIDENGDQVWQMTEPVLPYSKIYSSDKKYVGLSDGQGNVNMVLPVGQSITLNGGNDMGYICPKTFIINPSRDSIYQADFGFIPSKVNDVSIKIFCNTANKVKQGFETTYTIHLNNYSHSPQPVNISVGFNEKCTNFKYKNFNPVNGSKTRNGFRIFKNIGGQRNQSFTFSCVYEMDSFTLRENVYVSALTQLDDANAVNNTDTVRQIIVTTLDPNIKVSSPSSVVNNEKVINYTIFFQNLGNDVAANVTVIDSIGSLLEITRVDYIDGGPVKPDFKIENNRLVWTFRNIMLLPKKQDSIRSVGFIHLSVTLASHVKIGDSIFNKAYIYFDYQDPVITNKAKVVFIRGKNPAHFDPVSSFKIYPNPGTGWFVYENLGQLQGELQVFGIDGKQIYTMQLEEKGMLVLPESISTGVYILKIAGTDIELGKLILVK